MPTDELPITSQTIVKWGGIGLAAVSSLVTIIWFFASLKSDISSLRQENSATKTELNMKTDQLGKEVERLKSHADETDKSLNDMGRKLDVAVAILERIEKSVAK